MGSVRNKEFSQLALLLEMGKMLLKFRYFDPNLDQIYRPYQSLTGYMNEILFKPYHFKYM